MIVFYLRLFHTPTNRCGGKATSAVALATCCLRDCCADCGNGCCWAMLLLRGAIDQRFLATSGTTMMEVMVSGVVENSGAASGYRLVLLILLMLTTTAAASSASTATTASTSPVPEVLPLTFGRRWLLLLAIAAVSVVRYNSDTAGTVVDSSAAVILLLLLLLFAVDARHAASVVVMMICRTVGGRVASGRLSVHRLDISVGCWKKSGKFSLLDKLRVCHNDHPTLSCSS